MWAVHVPSLMILQAVSRITPNLRTIMYNHGVTIQCRWGYRQRADALRYLTCWGGGVTLGPASEPQVPQDRRPVHEELQIIRMLDPPSERYYCGSSQCRYGASLSTPVRRAQQYCVLCYLTHRLTTMMRLWLRSGPGAE
jgi:hypothetical protein